MDPTISSALLALLVSGVALIADAIITPALGGVIVRIWWNEHIKRVLAEVRPKLRTKPMSYKSAWVISFGLWLVTLMVSFSFGLGGEVDSSLFAATMDMLASMAIWYVVLIGVIVVSWLIKFIWR